MQEEEQNKQPQQEKRQKQETLKLTPSIIKNELDKFIVGQDEAKKTLSLAIVNHFKRNVLARDFKYNINKSNIILLGNTGCGKTYLMKSIARMFNVPFYIQDCTKITESGYVGSDVEECIVGLLRKCDYDVNRAQNGIVVLDECDKLASAAIGPSLVRDVGGAGVQQSLLKIVEGDVVGVPPCGGRKHPEQPLIYVNTSNILFVACGAFVGIDKIVRKRLGEAPKIGYGGDAAQKETHEKEELLSLVSSEDLQKYGMIPEFVARFPIVTHVNPLSEDELVDILSKTNDNLVEQYKMLLSIDNVELSFDDDALHEIARLAMSGGNGARGLRTIMETVMFDLMFEAPDWKSRKSFTVTADYVREKTKEKFKIAV